MPSAGKTNAIEDDALPYTIKGKICRSPMHARRGWTLATELSPRILERFIRMFVELLPPLLFIYPLSNISRYIARLSTDIISKYMFFMEAPEHE